MIGIGGNQWEIVFSLWGIERVMCCVVLGRVKVCVVLCYVRKVVVLCYEGVLTVGMTVVTPDTGLTVVKGGGRTPSMVSSCLAKDRRRYGNVF